MIIDKLIEAYNKLADEYSERYGVLTGPAAVIRMSNKGYYMLMAETPEFKYKCWMINDENGNCWLDVYGHKLPVIFDETIPDGVPFLLQTKENYIKQVQMELNNKIYRMFSI